MYVCKTCTVNGFNKKEKERKNERNKNKNLWIVKFMCDLKQFIIEPHMEKPYHIYVEH